MALVLYDALLRQRDLEEKPEGLDQTRREIDTLDGRLIQLLSERKEISRRIGLYKRGKGMRIRDRFREKEMLDQRIRWATDLGLEGDMVKRIFQRILVYSRRIQEQ